MSETKPDFKTERKFILDLLPQIRKIIMSYYRSDIAVDLKSDETPVTIADRETENIIRGEIIKKFPSHGIIGEELENLNENAEFKWVLDPIDGTKSFIAGVPLFGTLIALTQNGKPVLGCIYLPVTDEVLIGDGTETTLNGKPIRMMSHISLADSVILTTDYKDFSRYKPRGGFDKLVKHCRISRTWGDCYGYYLVATGRAHVMIDPAMSVWDKMALIPVIRGAGGEISDFHGNAPEDGDGIVASVAGLHGPVISYLNAKMDY